MGVLAGFYFTAAAPAQESSAAAESGEASASDKESSAESADKSAETKESGDDKKSASEDNKKGEKKAPKKKRKTHTVEADRFRVEVELDGTFVARETTELALRPESWSSFKIEEVVDHGSQVHEGETLIRFDAQKLDEAIADLELDLHLGELAIRRAEQELPRLERTLEMALDDAERSYKQVQEDYDRFQELEQAFYEKMVDYTVKGSEYSLTDAVEELKQLEKMYEADDLTEETEEIVLKRQRNVVDMATFRVEDAKLYRDSVLKITLPRMKTRMQDAIERSKLAVERAKMAMTLDMNRARYELEKRKTQQDQSRERHAKLLSDRSLMELKAPSDGIAYFGRCVDGRWVDMTSMINKLRPFGSASANSVLMTIVQPRPLSITATVDEEDRPSIEPGQPAKVTPPPKDGDKLEAKVASVSIAPVSSSKFRVNLELQDAEIPDWLVAGMSCKTKVTAYDKENALAVPEAAVHTDDENEDENYVWVVDPEDDDAKAERRNVKLGKHGDKVVEIVEGLAAGDVVSLEDENDDKEDDD